MKISNALVRAYRYHKFKIKCEKFMESFHKLLESGYDNSTWIETLEYELNLRRENARLFRFLLKYEFESIPELWSDHIKITHELTSYWEIRK